MSIVDFLIWCLVVFGASNGLVYSKLLHPFRIWVTWKKVPEGYEAKEGDTIHGSGEYMLRKVKFFGSLLSCVMCVGFWVGMASGLWMSPTGLFITDAFLGSAVSWLIFLFIRDKQERG